MNSKKVFGIVLTLMVVVASPVIAGEDLVQVVADGCKTEIDTYCKAVEPGDGRILACLYAYGDKLSGKCETKRGDDYAARVYVVIDGGLRFWKTRALNYVWSSNMAPESSWNNAFAGPNVRMLALRNNSNPTAEWFTEKRNILADLRHQFGDQIRYVDAIAIMTDTDNSMGEAISYYSDMYFSEK